jgi:hypothetical protein
MEGRRDYSRLLQSIASVPIISTADRSAIGVWKKSAVDGRLLSRLAELAELYRH